MLAPEYLQRKLQEWADTTFQNRTQAADYLAKHLRVSPSSARGYIDYRLDRATYDIVYRTWQFLSTEEGFEDV